MKRRSFLAGILSAPLAAILTGAKKTAPPENPEFVLNRFHVAGFQFYDGPSVIRRIKPGHRLDLVPEPDNAYDPRAIQILHEGRMIGYVPRKENKPICLLLAQGAGLECLATAIGDPSDPWSAVQAEVRITPA